MQYLTTVDVSQTHGQTPRLCSLSHGCIGVIFFTASLKRCACLPWSTERVRIHTMHCPLTRSATTVLITDWHLYIYHTTILSSSRPSRFFAPSNCSPLPFAKLQLSFPIFPTVNHTKCLLYFPLTGRRMRASRSSSWKHEVRLVYLIDTHTSY
jgi:hypothetical protein